MRNSILIKFVFFAIVALQAREVFAWGERGHDVVTRVAIQNLRFISDDNEALVRPFPYHIPHQTHPSHSHHHLRYRTLVVTYCSCCVVSPLFSVVVDDDDEGCC